MTKRIDRLISDFGYLLDTTEYSRVEIFQRAMALYKKATENKQAGGDLLMRSPDGTLTEIVGF